MKIRPRGAVQDERGEVVQVMNISVKASPSIGIGKMPHPKKALPIRLAAMPTPKITI